MIKKQKKLLISFVLVMCIGLFLANFYEVEKSNVLLAVFDKYDCDTIQGEISSNTKLKTPILNVDDMKKEAERVLTFLEIKNEVQIEKNENDLNLEYILTRNAEDSDTIVKIESKKDENKKIIETYLIVKTILYNKINSLSYVQMLYENMNKELGTEYNISITVVGTYKGKMKKSEEALLADKVLKSIKAKKVDQFETENIYSVYGYTDYIKNYIIQGKKRVNVNLAMRYNDYEDKTYLYLSTPIITTEY